MHHLCVLIIKRINLVDCTEGIVSTAAINVHQDMDMWFRLRDLLCEAHDLECLPQPTTNAARVVRLMPKVGHPWRGQACYELTLAPVYLPGDDADTLAGHLHGFFQWR